MISKSTTTDVEEKTEIIHGEENTVKKAQEDFLRVREKVDNCIDSTGPSVIITTEPVRSAFIDLKNRGIRIRFITEITKENIHYCKELMKIAHEVHTCTCTCTLMLGYEVATILFNSG